MDYNEELKLSNIRSDLYDSKTGKKGFDIRSAKEMETVNNIEEMIVNENDKEFVKLKTSGGFISALVLSLLSGFTLGAITTLTYIAIK